MSKSILQSWVTDLGLRHQGVLLTVVRGYDGWSKHSPQKPLIRELRGLILVPFDERELAFAGGFMCGFPHHPAAQGFKEFCDNIDGLPVHYVMHLVHAIEIVGYCHPEVEVRDVYFLRYRKLCDKFHLYPEQSEEMNARLGSDRIADGSVET
jgi:hypothetical protein